MINDRNYRLRVFQKAFEEVTNAMTLCDNVNYCSVHQNMNVENFLDKKPNCATNCELMDAAQMAKGLYAFYKTWVD